MTSSSTDSRSRTDVIACGAIARHIDDIAQRRGWDITIHPLPPLLHNSPKDIAPAVEALITELRPTATRLAVAYADCGTYGALDAVIEEHGIGRLRGQHCYDVFAGADTIQQILDESAGTYFFTDYLVKSFKRSVIVELGLDRHPELRDDYFRHYTRVIWLAQEPTEELRTAAEEAAAIMQLPLEIRNVGDLGLEVQLELLLRA